MNDLSYGQQKLVALACCLVADSQVLLLDEPFSGIHPAMVEKTARLIRDLAKQGRLILLIEHNIEAVRSVAKFVVAMDKGRIIAAGTSDVVLNRADVMESYLG